MQNKNLIWVTHCSPSIAEVNAYLFVCQPWRLITFCGSLLWVVICTSRSARHMFFDYWRWCARTLSAHCIVLSEADTQVKARNRSPTHANELILSNMHASPRRAVQWQRRDFAGIMRTVIFHYVDAKWGVTWGRCMSDPCQDSSCQFCTANFADRFWLLR